MELSRKRVTAGLLGLAAVGLVLTSACTGGAAPAPTTGAAAARGAEARGAANAETRTETQAPSSTEAQPVTMVASDNMRFEPAAITVEAGRPVRLTLRNDGRTTHDFTLSQGVRREVKLVAKPGESATATFTIDNPGTYRFVCSVFGHAMAGMAGTITA
ncbi:MAG TPA: cupredoxin domain-containing protein, partial [Chloroflexota bacterium]|nr:cupredoxin domain-containing protein [Chloroflexota bacterium]